MCLSFLLTNIVFSQQVSVNISVAPPYTPYLLDYVFASGKLTLQLKNNTRQIVQLKLAGSITGDNGLWLKTKPNLQPTKPIVLNPNEIKIFKTWQELQNIFDENNVDYSEIDPVSIARNGFPEGTYNICVRALDFSTGAQLSLEEPLGCSNPISINYIEPPVIISPVCNEEVEASNLIFRWAGVIGTNAKVNYTLRLVELPDNESNPNAFIDAVAIPIFEQKNIRTNSLAYNASFPILKPNTTYAYRITANDSQNKIVFLNDGKSVVCKFTYLGKVGEENK